MPPLGIKTFNRIGRFRKDARRLAPPQQAALDALLQELLKPEWPSPGRELKQMTNKDGIWEVRLDGAFRLTFHVKDGVCVLRRVGTHGIYNNP